MVAVDDGPGRSKLVRPAPTLAYASELRRILAHTGGLIPMLSSLLNPDERVIEAHIFGSWADRYHGQPGPFPNDIDIAIVSEFGSIELALPWRTIERELNIEINPRYYRPEQFDLQHDPVLSTSRNVSVK